MALTITPLSPALGAMVEGVNLNSLDAQAEQLRQAWADHAVLMFRGVHVDPDTQVELVSVFGRPEPHGVDGGDKRNTEYADDDKLITQLDGHRAGANNWHSDATFRETPPLGAMLALKEKPPSGGDTMWLSTTRAYETLAPPLQRLCEELTAEHGRPPTTGTARHPVLVKHPTTGKTILNVNRGWTNRIVGMPHRQAADLLQLLCNHIETPEHSVRWTWELGDAVLWDNRCTQHYALYDYGDQPRNGHRILLAS